MNKLVKFSLAIFGFFGLAKILSIIPFNRMAGDDYSSAIMARLGLFGSIIDTYKFSMGRFSAVLIETPFSSTLAHDGKITIYSLITFSMLIAAFIVIIKKITNLKLNNVYLYLLSIVFVAFLYQLTPNKSESWYWLTGSIVYLWPIITFVFAISYLFNTKLSKLNILLPTILIFFSTAFNEAFGLFIILFLVGALIYLRKDFEKRKLIISMLLASFTSFLIVYLAPGNDVRKAGYGSNPMSIVGSILYSISEGPKLYFSLISNNLVVLVALVILLSYFFVSVHKIGRNEKFNLDDNLFKVFMTIVSGLIFSAAFMFPSFIGFGRIQPDRSDISLCFVILSQVLIISFFIAKIISACVNINNYLYKIFITISALSLIFSAIVFTKSLPQDLYIARNYSIAFDQMIIKFREASLAKDEISEIKVSLPEHGLVAILLDPPGVYSYKNQSLSQYYKIGKVVTIPNEEEK